ncbi:MAG TPA: amidohydrolase [Chthoniobacterales bacterium]|jgi:hippurate hydrolase|nr:amidohydrolase [Chthoniobacterales bacterium]
MKISAAALAFLALISLPSLRAQDSIKQIVDQELPSLLTIYEDVHSHPELSTQEERTSALVAKELQAAGCEVTDHIGKYQDPQEKGYGVVGVMKNGEGPVVLVRTDMDALPVHEETGVPYASKVTTKNAKGDEVSVMHACGHDIHIATFIGVARELAKLKDQWHGTVLFVAQPAEELGTGARAMLHDGLYQRFPKPDFALGFHDNAQLPTGHIGVTPGYTYANVDSVDVTVHGVGGHGAYPHKTKDPVVLSAEIINMWQTIASREINPIDPVVVTVGSIHGGTKHNIISDEVKMQLTVRTYKKEVREQVLAAIAQIAKGCAIAGGWPEDKLPDVKVREDEFTPSTYNNPELTKRLVDVWKNSLGEKNVEIVDPTMGGEDFSEFSLPDHSIPAIDFHVGAVAPEKIEASKKPGAPPLPSLHSSKFAPVPEPTLRTGLVAMTSAVLDLMKK